ncbi:hypothetical protein PG999_006579 [Apiospora kogelbergensis]|uniref:Bromodomain associated domain-containing protein n=1 Tax=Apiospora kogelbergensis TaxID=1337665 RepID=A0AAW0QRM7_9PEZI
MATNEAPRGVPSTQYFHALLRPAILQILRAQGYYACSPAVIDNVTELAGRHLTELADRTARFMETNSEATLRPTISDVWAGEEDMKGVEDFISWAEGPKNAKIRRVAQAISEPTGLEDADATEEPANNYLAALKKKHNKNDQESKYTSTVLGKGNDHGDIAVEGGPVSSVKDWEQMMREAARRPLRGLSSLADDDVEMMEMEI